MGRQKFQNSQIPYAQRKLMEKFKTIAEHRDDAAKIALQVACVALNDTEGLGYLRLSKFAKRLQQLLHEYYEDPDVGEYHLHQRLEQLGFKVINGRMCALEDLEGNIVPQKMLDQVKKDGL